MAATGGGGIAGVRCERGAWADRRRATGQGRCSEQPGRQARWQAARRARARAREIEYVAEKAQEIEQRNNVPDAKTAAEPTTAEPERPKVREFAREGSLESAPQARRLPVRYRPPRLLGSGWAG